MDVLVVCAHPDADSFTHAITRAVERGLAKGGHHVTTLDLYALDFVAAMSTAEHRAYQAWDASADGPPVLDPMVAEHARLVGRKRRSSCSSTRRGGASRRRS